MVLVNFVAPAARRLFLQGRRGEKLPAGRRRYQTRSTKPHLDEIGINLHSP
jgi:hypothetical protein